MDAIDKAQQLEQEQRERALAAAARDIPPGVPGECDLCAEWSERLIAGICAPCRDKYKLP